MSSVRSSPTARSRRIKLEVSTGNFDFFLGHREPADQPAVPMFDHHPRLLAVQQVLDSPAVRGAVHVLGGAVSISALSRSRFIAIPRCRGADVFLTRIGCTDAVVHPELVGSSTSVAGMVSDGRTVSAGVVARQWPGR